MTRSLARNLHRSLNRGGRRQLAGSRGCWFSSLGGCIFLHGICFATGGLFHARARAPVHFCRGRICTTFGNQRIIGSHKLFALTSLGRGCLRGFVLRGLRHGHGHRSGLFRRGLRHIEAGRQRRFGRSIADLLQRSLGHQLAFLKIGAHAKITGGPFHTNNAEFLVFTALPVQPAHALGGKIGRRIELL